MALFVSACYLISSDGRFEYIAFLHDAGNLRQHKRSRSVLRYPGPRVILRVSYFVLPDCAASVSIAAMTDESSRFTFRPIGVIYSPYGRRIDAPHQGTVVEGTQTGEAANASLEIAEWLDEKSLQDLEGFERVWLIFVFHASEGWKTSVKPPRGGPKRGVLATRSPHRPNAIGLSAVELVAVDGRTLHLRGIDLLDGTPVLDVKPYIPYADAFPDAKAGWIDVLDAQLGCRSAPGPRKPR